ncbi:Di-copper centre-containing protein [Ramicandelaber brevisporus]|nr:Di-copper centre-containing protein [Ramicandelaber brevisporus]
MRSSFLAAALAVALCGTAAVHGQRNGCDVVKQRRELRTLSAAEHKKFLDAIKVMRSTASTECPGYNQLDCYGKLHDSVASLVHQNPVFLVFHRGFLNKFEDDIRKIDPTIAGVPYLEVGLDSGAPETSPLFKYYSASQGGGEGKPACVTAGALAGWTYKAPNGTEVCLKREFSTQTGVNQIKVPSYGHLQGLIETTSKFADFSTALEYSHHAYWHHFLGGTMLGMDSPNDPVPFWTLHAYLDKAFIQWQNKYDPTRSAYGGGSVNDNVPLLNKPVKDLLNHETQCYTYAVATGRAATRIAYNVTDFESRRFPQVTPGWLVRNKQTTQVRIDRYNLLAMVTRDVGIQLASDGVIAVPKGIDAETFVDSPAIDFKARDYTRVPVSVENSFWTLVGRIRSTYSEFVKAHPGDVFNMQANIRFEGQSAVDVNALPLIKLAGDDYIDTLAKLLAALREQYAANAGGARLLLEMHPYN